MKKWTKPEIKMIAVKKITLSGSGLNEECGNSGASKRPCSVV